MLMSDTNLMNSDWISPALAPVLCWQHGRDLSTWLIESERQKKWDQSSVGTPHPDLTPDSGTARISSGVVKIRTQKSSTVHCLILSLVISCWRGKWLYRVFQYGACGIQHWSWPVAVADFLERDMNRIHTFASTPTPSHHTPHRTCCNSSFNTLNLSVSRMLQYKRRESLETQLPIKGEYCVDPGVSLLITKARCNNVTRPRLAARVTRDTWRSISIMWHGTRHNFLVQTRALVCVVLVALPPTSRHQQPRSLQHQIFATHFHFDTHPQPSASVLELQTIHWF